MILTPPQLRSKDPTERRIRVFEQRYGKLAKDLAAYAAFPLTLTTDLVYCLRETFVPQCPWYTAADVLLSGLCTMVGYDLYEMEVATRRYLLRYLCEKFGELQVYEVERFMVAYLRHRIKLENSDRPLILGEKPHWTALACLQPGQAFNEIKQTLQKLALADPDPKERFRFAALVESYGDFLGDKFQPILLDLAERIAEGKAIDQTSDITNTDEPTQDDALQSFEIETVMVNDRGEVVSTSSHEAFYFVDPLAEGTPSLEMVAIRSGEFMMGSPTSELDRYDDESPQHQVVVQPFFISKYPVTQAQWQAVATLPKVSIDLESDPSYFKGANRPVEGVSWDDAVEFCARLSEKTGRNYRLPSEAEWEYACRAGTTTPFHFGEAITTDLVNYDGNYPYGSAPKGQYRQQTTEVGSFPPNSFGLYDMHGNIWEWCADHWHNNYDNAPNDGSIWLSSDESSRLLRGGSWSYDPYDCRSACRNWDNADVTNYFIGFRVVCS